MKTRRSLQIVLLVAVVVAVVPVVWIAQVQAQAAPQGSQPVGLTAGAQHEVQGKITAVDPSRKMLTLEDGTRLTIPPTVQLPRDIKEGSIVKASFEEQSGQNVVTSLEVQRP